MAKTDVMGLLLDTFQTSVNLFDRSAAYLPEWVRHEHQMIAGVCLLIASKYFETKCPPLEDTFEFLLVPVDATGKKIRFIDSISRIRINVVEVLVLRAVGYRVRCMPALPVKATTGPRTQKIHFKNAFYVSHLSEDLAIDPELGQGCVDLVEYLHGAKRSCSAISQNILHFIIRVRMLQLWGI
jgi:hypothetical protein